LSSAILISLFLFPLVFWYIFQPSFLFFLFLFISLFTFPSTTLLRLYLFLNFSSSPRLSLSIFLCFSAYSAGFPLFTDSSWQYLLSLYNVCPSCFCYFTMYNAFKCIMLLVL
jgi:hypothetical protein